MKKVIANIGVLVVLIGATAIDSNAIVTVACLVVGCMCVYPYYQQFKCESDIERRRNDRDTTKDYWKDNR